MKHVKLFEEYESEVINEGKLQRGFYKGAISIAALILKFKKLFNKTDRKNLLKDIKNSNKMIDLLSYIADCESWLTNDKLSKNDIKTLADNLGIDEKHPTEWDIFEARYKLEFKRELKTDLDAIIETLDSPYKGKDPITLAYFRDIKEMATSLKNLVR